MKRGLVAICLSLCLLLLTGCGKEQSLTCTRTMTQGGMKYDLSYKINYKGKYVTDVETVEKMTGDKDTLEVMKTTLENTYATYNEIEHFNNKVEIVDEELVSTTTIDYENIDVDKLTELDSKNASLFTKGKVELETLKKNYEATGAICE